LQQNGNSVTGTVNLGGLTGSVTGTVNNGILSLQGTVTGSDFTARITAWSTTIQGTSGLAGTVNYDLTLRALPGVAGIESRLESVTR
jgi:osmotically-inducible protein OsmY